MLGWKILMMAKGAWWRRMGEILPTEDAGEDA
jgi:hypothetical protein